MSFVSMELLLLVLVAAIIYYIMPKKYQWILLLIVSYLLYISYGVKPLVFIIFTTVTTFLGGIYIEKTAEAGKAKLEANKADMMGDEKKKLKAQIKHRKRCIVAMVLIANFGILAFLKYFNFALENINSILHIMKIQQSIPAMKLLLPIGISFYTFQAMGYIIDIYQGKYKSEKNVFKFALFISFFPQILQGPIGRFNKLAEQFTKEHTFEIENIQYALQLIFWGFFKKIVLADRAAVVVNEVFGNYNNYSGFYVIFAVLLYSVQLYADFSGGMDIVIGIAQIFGIKLDQNFARPFFSHSIGEFWRRWHITLGAWMKDYIFYPFSLSKAMNKFGKVTKKKFGNTIGRILPVCVANLLIFFIVGVWHGAEWKFIAYGMYNGIIIALSNLLEPVYTKLHTKLHIDANSRPWRVFQIIRTFILVNIGWYFDMGTNLSASFTMLGRTVKDLSLSFFTEGKMFTLGLDAKDLAIICVGCIIWFVISVLQEKKIRIREAIAQRPLIVRWIIYFALIFATPLIGYIGGTSGFLYAQF